MQQTESGRYSSLLRLVFTLWISGVSLAIAGERSNRLELSFGIVPQQSAQKLAALWQPVFDVIHLDTGYEVRFKTAPSIPEFEKRLAAAEYDVAYMNPYHFTVFNASPGYHAIAHAKDKSIKGIVVVRADSPIKTLADLEGQTLAFPAPAAFAASVLPRASLAASHINIQARYVQTHDSVYLTVARGIYAAGGGIQRTFKGMPEEIQNQLRVLWTTPGYTPHAIACRPTLPKEVCQTLQRSLVGLDSSKAGRTALQGLDIIGFTAATDDEWDDVRALGIEQLKHLQQESGQ